MKIFDTRVQELKYDVLREVIKAADKGDMSSIYIDIPKLISPGPKPTMRCCIYKERAIVQERIKMALGGDKSNPNSVEVIDAACDACPIEGMYITPACRGCTAFTVVVAISRIVANAHFLSDVLVGGYLTYLIFVALRRAFFGKGKYNFAVALPREEKAE